MVSDEYPEFSNPMERPRYVGIPTFFRAPWKEDLKDVDIGIVGIPFDGGVTNRPGSRHGPREVRNQSTLVRLKNQATNIAPHELCRVADIGDAWVPAPFEHRATGCWRRSFSDLAGISRHCQRSSDRHDSYRCTL